jgi:hypothetical protein
MPWRGQCYLYLAIGLTSWLTACGDDGGGVTPPTSSDLQIIVATSGSSPDPDGYTITLDGAERGTLGASGTLTLTELTPGSHLVGLTGIAPNCLVDGDNPRAVTVPEEGSATVAFAISCTTPAPTAGTIQVATATTGSDLDPDGYLVLLDGNPGLPITVNGSVTLTDVPAGNHTVTLDGVASNCAVAEGASRSVAVSAGGVSAVGFTIACTTTGPGQVVKVSGDEQRGPAGAPLSNPLVVRVLDAAGAPVVGATVTWEIVGGGGSVSPQSSSTNAQGRASTRWTLGAVGSNSVRAAVSGVGSVTFNATAEAAAPSASRSTVEVDPDAIPVGETSTITVRVRDSGGNPLAGVPVTVSSSGTDNEITPASATSNAQGVATFSFTSTAGGNKTITAVAGGVTVSDTEVITVIRASSTTRITGHQPDPSASGQEITVTFSVTGNGGRGAPTGEITIFSLLEADVGCTVPVSQGSCTFDLNTPGVHSLIATYSGDDQFEDSVSPAVNHTVTSASALVQE